MVQAIIRLLTFNVMSLHPMVYYGLGSVWIILLAAALMSLRSLDLPTGRKVAWFLFIFFLPIAGLACYCLRCVVAGDWTSLKPLFSKPKPLKS